MEINYLLWDSDFFQLKIGSILLQEDTSVVDILQKGRNQGYDLLYGFQESDQNITNIPLQLKPYYQTTNVLYSKKLMNGVNAMYDGAIREGKYPDDLAKLNALSIQAGHSSRFKLDLKFGYEKFKALYEIWLSNSIQKFIADHVLVHHHEDIEGFITIKTNDHSANIGLIAVDSQYRNKNIGGKLIQAAEVFANNTQCSVLEVGTQVENEGACRFYEKNGFSLIHFNKIFHFWL